MQHSQFKYQKPLSLLLFLTLWGYFLSSLGTIESGYHLTDDHEILRINRDLLQNNLLDVISNWLTVDLQIRFRPAYFLQRIIFVRLFGTDFLALSIATYIMASLSSWLLFMFARKIGLSTLMAFLFVAFSLLGTQSEIWWRLGTNETCAMFWLAAGLFFMARAADSAKLPDTAIAIICIAAASLSKESFIILLPAIVFWWLWINSQFKRISLASAFFSNIKIVLAFSLIFLAELAMITLKVGTAQIGYAGVDNTLETDRIITTINQFCLQTPVWLAISLFSFLLLIAKWRSAGPNSFQQLAYAFILLILITAPQIVLYAKSGIFDRYLLPGTVGISFLIAFMAEQICKMLPSKIHKRIFGLILASACFYVLSFAYSKASTKALQFVAEGKEINLAFSDIIKNTPGDDTILIVADPALDYEFSYSSYIYLNESEERTNVFIYQQRKASYHSGFFESLADSYQSLIGKEASIDKLEDKSSIKVILTYKETDSAFRRNWPGWLGQKKFRRNDFGKFITYVYE